MRLYRRVIEIRDGYLALTPVAVPGIEDVIQAAAGRDRLGPADQGTLAAAVQLELARRAELRGDSGGPGGLDGLDGLACGDGLPTANREFLAATDLDGEVRLLRTVAAHWDTVSLAAEQIERSQAVALH
jgi:hypothetical protein